MQRDNTPESSDSGLSTEDFAQPHQTADEPPGAASSPPVFPGEGDESAATGNRSETESRPTDAPTTEASTAQQSADPDETPRLLKPQDEDDFHKRWEKIQNTFVDDPREAVQAADSLVANVMQTLATTFDEHKKQLEEQWNRSGQADTEALRTALRHYRSFFNRLLTT
ncbi:hypothetical protein AB0451_39680 [Streptomyces sp. NPDC052000]|uniref:hypothetical protein n=1 Tax=Streptomyces sp. NPDC052000 TaxID=3155676 RepID=UPI00344CC854